jgi:valyl-tRNA synthetase
VPLAGVIDIERECRKAKTELEKLDAQLAALSARLSNPGFTDRAPAHVVEAERAKQGEWSARRIQLAEKVTSLCGS